MLDTCSTLLIVGDIVSQKKCVKLIQLLTESYKLTNKLQYEIGDLCGITDKKVNW